MTAVSVDEHNFVSVDEHKELDNLLFWNFLGWQDAAEWLCTKLAPFGASPQEIWNGGAAWAVLELLRRRQAAFVKRSLTL